MSSQDNLDNIFAKLRQSEPHLSGDAFTRAVVGQLPEPNELPVWFKNLLLLCATVIGSAIAAWELPAIKLSQLIGMQNLVYPVLGVAAMIIYILSGVVIWGVRRGII